MSSTDDEKRAGEISIRSWHRSPKVRRCRSARGTFYVDVPPVAKADFELRVGCSSAEVRESLLQQWRALPALHPLAEALATFADTLPKPDESAQSTELSPFVYVMF